MAVNLKIVSLTDRIIDKACSEVPLTGPEILQLLDLQSRPEIERLFQAARKVRERHFRNQVFLYGFVYFSTHCKNDCAFCLYRRSNTALSRYRKSQAEIMETALSLVESGVHLLDLTMGEDPQYFAQGTRKFEQLFSTIRQIKQSTGIPLMISPGVVSDSVLRNLKNAGVSWYACYQETHNLTLYEKLRLNQSYTERLEKKNLAHKYGMLVEEGLLTGVGDTSQDVLHSLEVMQQMRADQVRVMSFVPQVKTPMHDWPSVARIRELIIIAVMRFVFPDRLIPASLDVDGLTGLELRLNAGANVVTSLIPPRSGLAGVSQNSLDIEEGNRTIKSVIPVLDKCGLAPASQVNYNMWIQKRQNTLLTQQNLGGAGHESSSCGR